MSEHGTPDRHPLLRDPIRMGVARIQPTVVAAVFKTPGVYVQEVPSGVAD